MKKLLVGLIATVLMALGLVGTASGPAEARDCTYQGCVWTQIKLKNEDDISKIRSGKTPHFDIKIKVSGGDPAPTPPSGVVKITCTSPNGTHVKSGTGEVVDGSVHFSLNKPLNKRGIWLCEARYSGDDPFRRDSYHFQIKVV